MLWRMILFADLPREPLVRDVMLLRRAHLCPADPSPLYVNRMARHGVIPPGVSVSEQFFLSMVNDEVVCSRNSSPRWTVRRILTGSRRTCANFLRLDLDMGLRTGVPRLFWAVRVRSCY